MAVVTFVKSADSQPIWISGYNVVAHTVRRCPLAIASDENIDTKQEIDKGC
jgi:hypothetical protein